MSKLSELQVKYPQIISRVRGKGTYIAFDVQDGRRDKLIFMLRQKGINTGGSGSCSLRLRPMLIFTPTHAEIFIKVLNEVLSQL